MLFKKSVCILTKVTVTTALIFWFPGVSTYFGHKLL